MRVESIARAVLYEGFALYPYRPSAPKNRRRVLFGTLYPAAWPDGDASAAVLECLVVGVAPSVRASLRFLALDDEDVREEVVETEPTMRFVEADRAAIDAEKTRFVRGARSGAIEIANEPIREGVARVRARISCDSACAPDATRDEAERAALGAAHLVLHVEGGRFVSLIDPPPELADDAARCVRAGLFGILVGDAMLASPIALDDQPAIAPESGADFHDATEIEEMLCLRVQTLTDAEKDEIRAAGGRGRAVLEHVAALGADELLRLHGARRDGPFTVGDRVRVRAGARADALDIVLDGMPATVVSIERTVEGERLACVTIDADPGKDLGARGFPGHRFFFRETELERSP